MKITLISVVDTLLGGTNRESDKSHGSGLNPQGGSALLTRHGLSQQLSLSERTVDWLVEALRIPVIHAGRSVWYRLDRVSEALHRNATQESI